jgi:hypothetical protein
MPLMSQGKLFDDRPWWDEYWQDMPEYSHEDQAPYYQLIVNFADRAAVERFEKLLGVRLACNPSSRQRESVWYPAAPIGTIADKRYKSSG